MHFHQPHAEELINQLKGEYCDSSASTLYDCLQDVPADELLQSYSGFGFLDNPFKPTADGDFFEEDISIHSYKPTHRYVKYFYRLSARNYWFQELSFKFSRELLCQDLLAGKTRRLQHFGIAP